MAHSAKKGDVMYWKCIQRMRDFVDVYCNQLKKKIGLEEALEPAYVSTHFSKPHMWSSENSQKTREMLKNVDTLIMFNFAWQCPAP